MADSGIKMTQADWLLEMLAGVGVLSSVVMPLMYFGELSPIIPTHFNAAGEADGTGSKFLIWLLPGVVVFVYTLLTFAARIPDHLNYPFRTTGPNAALQQAYSIRMIRILKVLISFFFLFPLYATIQGGLGNKFDLGAWFLAAFLISIFSTIGWTVYKCYQLRK